MRRLHPISIKAIVLVLSLLVFANCSSVKDTQSFMPPSDIFVAYANSLMKKDWVNDTARVNQLNAYDLKASEVHFFKNLPFYNLDFSNTSLGNYLKSHKNQLKNAMELVSKSKKIWVYYYHFKQVDPKTRLLSDGIIEQWHYSNETEAQLAAKEMKQIIGEVFFNTTPYLVQKQQDIYLFHTRAMAFSFDQQDLFNEFVCK